MDKKAELYEKNNYENTSFPFEIYYVKKYSITPSGRGFDNLHWHEEIQYTIATKGDLTIQINGHNYLLKEGEAIFINSQYLHITKQMDEDGRYFSINFSTKLLSFFLGSLMEREYVVPYVNDYLLPVIVFEPKQVWKKQVLKALFEIEAIYSNKQLLLGNIKSLHCCVIFGI
ncbi:cupin domain-containing protein [Enterococcus raffinosus]|uniref:cupin domain-containing protein n=1 Tax=Enterococcus raffinosus TaxID=71452 RepID=UPI0021BC028B|nr:cupin domain-containing protein [Enterococcus raffinosus]